MIAANTYWTLSLHSLAECLLAFGIGFSVVLMLLKRNSNGITKGSKDWSNTILSFRLLLRTINWAMCAICFVLGFVVNQLRHYSNVRTYQNVEVTRAYDPFHYKLLIGYSEYDAQICTDGPSPDWQAGMTLPVLMYEQMSGCKKLYGDDLRFTELRDEDGKPILKKEFSNVSEKSTQAKP